MVNEIRFTSCLLLRKLLLLAFFFSIKMPCVDWHEYQFFEVCAIAAGTGRKWRRRGCLNTVT